MTLTYTNGRLQLTFGSNSRFSRLFATYAQKIAESYFSSMPSGIMDIIYSNFADDLDPHRVSYTAEDEEFQRRTKQNDRPMPLDDIIGIPEGLSPWLYWRLEEMHDAVEERWKKTDFTELDHYNEHMGRDIALYLKGRIIKTIEALHKKQSGLDTETYELKVGVFEKAKKRLDEIKDGLYDVILIFELPDGQVYTHDRQKELFHKL